MLIFPAIDLKDGRAVRLTVGDYARMRVYDPDPERVAKGFRDAGATHLHVVDLDAARDGAQKNLPVIKKILAAGLITQVGGGARDEESVARYLDAGVARVILGSAAVESPAFLEKSARAYPGRICAGYDAKDGRLAIHGWRELTDTDAFEALSALPGLGVEFAVYTDIARDGLLAGPNLAAYERAAKIPRLKLIASGGVTGEKDIAALRRLGLYGTIVGKALYEGRLRLEDALAAAKEAGQ